jgi:OmpA-OmpF porin, OOP family
VDLPQDTRLPRLSRLRQRYPVVFGYEWESWPQGAAASSGCHIRLGGWPTPGPAAHAQSGPQEVPPPETEGLGDYLVFFAFDSAELDADARQTVAQAAEAYRRTGDSQQITATGHTDTSGSAEYNLGLSQRRAEAVANELIRLGVPAADIVTVGRGEEDLLVPTADGVREPRNRRVEIVVPQPPPAP